MKNTKIDWASHSFNGWEGCEKVSPGCDHCYAEARNARFAGGRAVNWGPGAPRRRTSAANWSKPRKWAAEHAAFLAEHGHRQRVFCSSLADVFDNAVDPQWRADLFALISQTPELDWLLLTKRIGNVRSMLPANWGDGWPNVWIGATVVNQAEADRDIPKLLQTPAALRFLSIEPMLGPIDLRRFLTPTGVHCIDVCPDTRYILETEVETIIEHGEHEPLCPRCGQRGSWTGYDAGVDWVIVGGESGRRSHARPMHPAWPKSIRDQCRVAAVPFLFKQWGEWNEFVNEDHYTHCGDERHSHAWVDAGTGDHGLCWIVDDDGVWSNHTGEPPTDENGHIVEGVAVMGWFGKSASGRALDGQHYDEFPDSAAAPTPSSISASA
jgi:protein gp37